MELEGDVRMEPSSSTCDDQGYNLGSSGSGSSMETDGPDDKPGDDSSAGPSCSKSSAARDKGDTPSPSSTNEEGNFSKKIQYRSKVSYHLSSRFSS